MTNRSTMNGNCVQNELSILKMYNTWPAVKIAIKKPNIKIIF